ncbi:hypothetical protein [Gordonia polyisoprenivorans]|nr:hypothetical protein [Gordonia polyisoprenivorans]
MVIPPMWEICEAVARGARRAATAGEIRTERIGVARAGIPVRTSMYGAT